MVLYNIDAINGFYRGYEAAGAALNKAVEETFTEVFKDFGFVPVRIQPTSVRPSKSDRLVLIDIFYLDTNSKLVFEDVESNVYPVIEIAYRPMNMYLLYQSFAKDVKIK